MEAYAKEFDDTGLPFKSNEDVMCMGKRVNATVHTLQALYNRVSKVGLPSLIIIDGGLSQGKTTLGFEIGDYFNSLAELPPIDEKGIQYSLGGDAFSKNLDLCWEKGYPCIIYDEAGDFNRKATLSKFNRNIDKIFNQYRAYNIIPIIILPCINYLDNDLFTKGVLRTFFNCYGRSDRNIGRFRAYDIERTNWVRHYMKKEVNPLKAYDRVTANNYGFFYNLSPERSKNLAEVGLKYKRQSIGKANMELSNLIDAYEMASKMDRSVRYVKDVLKKLKIKPKLIHRKRNMFERDVFERVKAYKGGY